MYVQRLLPKYEVKGTKTLLNVTHSCNTLEDVGRYANAVLGKENVIIYAQLTEKNADTFKQIASIASVLKRKPRDRWEFSRRSGYLGFMYCKKEGGLVVLGSDKTGYHQHLEIVRMEE